MKQLRHLIKPVPFQSHLVYNLFAPVLNASLG